MLNALRMARTCRRPCISSARDPFTEESYLEEEGQVLTKVLDHLVAEQFGVSGEVLLEVGLALEAGRGARRVRAHPQL